VIGRQRACSAGLGIAALSACITDARKFNELVERASISRIAQPALHDLAVGELNRYRRLEPCCAARQPGRSATAAEFLVIDTITEHDLEPDKKFAGKRHFRLGSAVGRVDAGWRSRDVKDHHERERRVGPPDRGLSGEARCLDR
jgi:hypothetical protein